MAEIVVAKAIQKLFELLVGLFHPRKNSGLNNFHTLATKKFKEIEDIHNSFAKILTQFQSGIAVTSERIKKTDDVEVVINDVITAVKMAGRLRDAARERRRASYEEAKVYTETLYEDKASVLTALPDEVVASMKSFMSAYCAYFERAGRYQHQLGNVLDATQSSMELFLHRKRNPRDLINDQSNDHLQKDLESFSLATKESLEAIRNNWATVANAYYQLDRSCREHGLDIAS
jgi:hypothetical protein